MSSRSLYVVAFALLLGALACAAPAGGTSAIETPTVAQPTATSLPPTPSPLQPTATPLPPTSPPDPSDTPADDRGAGGDPAFTGPIRFTTDPDSPDDQRSFQTGVQEIWAVWDYSGMSADDVVRRVWYQNGEEWLVREEAWDFDNYGASGTVRDISIYDYEDGLEPGEYRLRLFINDQEQMLSNQAGFDIGVGEAEDDVAYPSPDRSRTAIIRQSGTLLLTEIDGGEKTLAEHGEITTVDWFPDNQHLVYEVLDRSSAPDGPTIDWAWELWIVDVESGETWQISQGDEQLHDPAVSPQGDVIAVVAGSGYGDAGMIDQQLGFMYLDVFLQRNDLIYAADFQGFPADSVGSVYPTSAADMPLPGQWVSIAEFRAIMNMTWQVEDLEPGIYAFFMRDRMAGRVGDLPPDIAP
jgi:hypothetical protein